MAFLLKWSLYRKLLLLSICVLLPVITFSYYLIQENISTTQGQILASSAATADLVASQLDDFVQSTEKLLQTIAKTEVVRSRQPSQTTDLLLSTVVLYPDYKIIFTTAEDGRIFASGITGGMLHDNVASLDYRAALVMRDAPVVSGRLPSEFGGDPVVNVFVPLNDDTGRVVGSVGAGVSLTNLQRRLTGEAIKAQGARVIVVDGGGSALVHPNWDYVMRDTSLARFPPVFEGLNHLASGTVEYVDPEDKKTYLAAYARAKAANWTVVVSYPAALAYMAVQRAALRGLTGLAISAAVAVVAALILSARFAHPLGELAKKTKHVLADLPAQPAGAGEHDEVRQLALAIDVMSSDLARHADELAKTKREIDKRAAELRTLAAKAITVQDEERKRLALDVHDGLAQLISWALAQAQDVDDHLMTDPETSLRRLRSTEQLLNQAVLEVKRVMLELRPTKLEGGLASALQRSLDSLQGTFGLACTLDVVGEVQHLPADAEVTVYRIVQEGLSNVRRHARASNVKVTVEYARDALQVIVEDDGRGFDPESAVPEGSGGLGLLGMRERAESLGAALKICSAAGRGTTIRLALCTSPATMVAQSPISSTGLRPYA